MLEIIEYIFVIFLALPLFGFFGLGMLITFFRWLFSVFDNEDLFDNFLLNFTLTIKNDHEVT